MKLIRSTTIALTLAALSAGVTTALDNEVFVDSVRLDASQVCVNVHTETLLKEKLFEDGSGTRIYLTSDSCRPASSGMVEYKVENDD